MCSDYDGGTVCTTIGGPGHTAGERRWSAEWRWGWPVPGSAPSSECSWGTRIGSSS